MSHYRRVHVDFNSLYKQYSECKTKKTRKIARAGIFAERSDPNIMNWAALMSGLCQKSREGRDE